MRLLVGLLAMVLMTSCSKEKAPESGRPGMPKTETAVSAGAGVVTEGGARYSLRLTPADAVRDTLFVLMPEGFNPAEARIDWYVNGAPVEGAHSLEFRASNLRKGDTVQARTFLEGKDITTEIVTIRNSPPLLADVRFVPSDTYRPGDRFGVEAKGADPDGDTVEISYEWFRNGGPSGKEKFFEGEMKRGDRIQVRITPFDGYDYGSPAVLNREILNMQPVIVEDDKIEFDGRTLTGRIKASDPDGDPLTFTLKSGPEGLSIDRDSGQITWPVPQSFRGRTSAVVVVSDGRGGETTDALTIDISNQK